MVDGEVSMEFQRCTERLRPVLLGFDPAPGVEIWPSFRLMSDQCYFGVIVHVADLLRPPREYPMHPLYFVRDIIDKGTRYPLADFSETKPNDVYGRIATEELWRTGVFTVTRIEVGLKCAITFRSRLVECWLPHHEVDSLVGRPEAISV